MRKYCRICFKNSSNKKDPMLPLSVYTPLIKMLAKTELVQEESGESNICQSCANILIMANLFRVKIIESNAVFRELLESSVCDKTNGWKLLDGFDLEDFTSQPVIIEDDTVFEESNHNECFDESFENTQELNGSKNNSNKEQLKSTKMKTKQTRKEKIAKIIETSFLVEMAKSCSVCGENKTKQCPNQMILKTILPSLASENVQVCSKCCENVRRVEVFIKHNYTVKSSDKDKCQFCLKSEIRMNPLPKYLFNMYNNNLPEILKKVPEIAKVDKITCNECLKALQFVSEIQNDHNIKIRNDRRLAQSIPSKSFEGKLLKAQNKKLKRRSHQKFVEPASDEELPGDFQCHLSDFEEVESDIELPPVKFGDPLNVPFTPNYLECTECRTKCITTLEMEVHIEVMHRTFSNICNLCNKKFKNLNGAQNHKDNVHFLDCSYSVNGRNSKKSLCDICGLRSKEFKSHYDIHTGAKKDYECHFCGHKARVKDRLKFHIFAMHTNIRRYKCKYCDKGFSYAQDARRHEISSHTKEYKYICGICNKGFIKKNFLTAHQKTHNVVFGND